MADERLRLTAEMRDRLTPALRRLQSVMSATGRNAAFQRLAMDMSRLERAGYRAGFMLGRTLKYGVIGAAGAATIASAAMIKLGKTAVDSLDDIKAFSGQVDISADGLRILQGVADRFNVSQGSLRAGLQSFNARLGQLKSGQGAFLGFLKKTNPALAAQMKHVKSTQEGYVLLFDALSKISDPSKRAALAKAAGIGQESLRFLADGPDGLRLTIKQVRELLGVFGPEAYNAADAFNDSLGDVGLALQGLSAKMAVSVLPTLTPMLQDLATFLATNRDRIASGFKQVIGDIATALQGFGSWIASPDGGAALKAFWSDLKDIASALAEVAKAVNSVVQSFGGWKVVLGTIVALKAAKWAKGLATDVLPALPGSKAPGTSAAGMPSTARQGGLTGFLFLDLLMGMPSTLDQLSESLKLAKERSDAWNASLEKLIPKWMYSGDGWVTKPGTRTQLDPGLVERARRSADEYRRDPEGTRGRMWMQLTAGSVGKRLGEQVADSLYKRMQLLLGTGGGGSGNNVTNAVWRPAGRAQAATRAAFAPGSGGKGMLDLIASAEGTGNNYNETLANGRLTGGPVNLTGMTLDQIDALQTRMLRHPKNKWNSSALGRYQFVQTRLRELRKRYGLSGSALFSPDLQDALGRLSLAERGGSVRAVRNEWQGLNKVPATVLRDAIRNHRRRQDTRPASRIEGSASLDVRFHNAPAGTRVGSKVAGLFQSVNLDTGRSMQEAMA